MSTCWSSKGVIPLVRKKPHNYALLQKKGLRGIWPKEMEKHASARSRAGTASQDSLWEEGAEGARSPADSPWRSAAGRAATTSLLEPSAEGESPQARQTPGAQEQMGNSGRTREAGQPLAGTACT